MQLNNVQLTLMIGPILPMTPPRAVMDSLAEVEVKTEDVGTSGFQIRFSIDKQSPLQILFLLTGGLPLLFMRLLLCLIPRRLRRSSRWGPRPLCPISLNWG